MKHLYLFVLLFPFVLSAQRVQDNDVEYTFIQLPLNPLPADIKNYSGKIEQSFIAKNEEMSKAYDEEVAKAEREYQDQLVIWEKEANAAQENYDKEMAAYNEKSGAAKLLEKKLLEEGKPVLRLPSKPYLRTPNKPTTEKEFNASVMASTYIKLYGYNEGKDNAVKITYNLHGWEETAPERKSKTESVSDKSGTHNVTKYWMEWNYKHPVSVKVELPDGKILCDEIVPGTNDYTVYSTAPNTSSPSFDEIGMRNRFQDEIVTNNMLKAKTYLNSRFGYSPIERKSVVYTVKPNKFQYPEFDDAMMNCIGGYGLLKESSTEQEGMEALKRAITSWESALKEFNPNDKKARIDEDVAIAAYFNLIEAKILVRDFTPAQQYIFKMKTFKLKNKEEAALEKLEDFYQDQKKRFDANKK